MPYRHTTYAGLAATDRPGTDPDAPAFVFLHGLTFDSRMWEPILDELPAVHRAIALDLPGHGGSPPYEARGLAPVVDAVRAAAAAAAIDTPIRLEPFAAMLDGIGPQVSGPGFGPFWAQLNASLQADRVPPQYRELVRQADQPLQDLFLRYQADLLERPIAEVVRWRDEGMAAV